MSENYVFDDDDIFPHIWELRSYHEVLGILRENDWHQPPFWGFDFEPSENYKKYVTLFEESNYARDHISINIRMPNGGYIPNTPEEITKQKQNLSRLNKQIHSLKLTMYSVDKPADPSRIISFVIRKNKVQLIPDFEYYNPLDYPDWNTE